MRIAYVCALGCLIICPAAHGWSNRGHRLINKAAVLGLPPEMPGFIRSPKAAAMIAYLGPEPDRWRPETAPELSAVNSPDHVFLLELADPVAPFPRRRYDFVRKFNAYLNDQPSHPPCEKAPECVGMLPWQVNEIAQRLTAAFRAYRVLTGSLPRATIKDIEPMTREDLPLVEQTALFYAGWLGHYVGDGAQPLHTTVNSNAWVSRQNPGQYQTAPGIHAELEAVADGMIENRAIQPADVAKRMASPKHFEDDFDEVIRYLEMSHQYVGAVYELKKQQHMRSNDRACREFVVSRMSAGSEMLRNLIYSAWVNSGHSAAGHENTSPH